MFLISAWYQIFKTDTDIWWFYKSDIVADILFFQTFIIYFYLLVCTLPNSTFTTWPKGASPFSPLHFHLLAAATADTDRSTNSQTLYFSKQNHFNDRLEVKRVLTLGPPTSTVSDHHIAISHFLCWSPVQKSFSKMLIFPFFAVPASCRVFVKCYCFLKSHVFIFFGLMFNRFGGFPNVVTFFPGMSWDVPKTLVLFLSLNVDGVFLNTAELFFFVIVFLFCFLLFCSFVS